MQNPFEPTIFIRDNIRLHALLLDKQAWFCLRDIGHLLGMYFDDRIARKLSSDQRCMLKVWRYDVAEEMLMVSESAVYALFILHQHPANPNVRRWLIGEVLPYLRDDCRRACKRQPSQSRLMWQGQEISVLHWRNELWIRLRDMPELLPIASQQERAKVCGRLARLKGWLRGL